MAVRHRIFALAVLLALLAPALSAANPCWRYAQSASCTSYPLTDFALSRPLPGAKGSPAREADLSTSLGWLFRVSKRFHAGPALLFSAYLDGGWHAQVGLQSRIRLFATPAVHFDFAPGLILYDSPYPSGFAGYSAEISCGYRDWVSLISRLDVVDEGLHDRQTVIQLGIRVGSYPGLALTAAGALVGGLGYIWSQMD